MRFSISQKNLREDLESSNYIGGVDISFLKDSETQAAAGYVIYSMRESKIVHQDTKSQSSLI
ncbi:Hypothetical protein FKW44_013181 [Caligus rogercresseyi]|uniref:Uncharacterized protein n=1 Tax=Caligus rogercresseyi TaxID=217165 RepID=A0A7T8HKH6_CALRO|nr:Hypothetical protein FKW44_013181 [Caligus rogercresseyi]